MPCQCRQFTFVSTKYTVHEKQTEYESLPKASLIYLNSMIFCLFVCMYVCAELIKELAKLQI